MQIELIDTFLDLLETRSFNKTAENIGVTQSTVSARVAALERAVGRKLFTRSRAGTDLTTAGLRFEPHAKSLRHAWEIALRATRSADNTALALQIGLQTDLAGSGIGDWMAEFRAALPETSFYLELDYSPQMCRELRAGRLDFGVMYTPHPGPDLHFESVGELRYVLVSTEGPDRAAVAPARHIRANYSPAFDQQFSLLYPDFIETPVASGQNAGVAGLLTSLGGSAFVLQDTARDLVAQGGYHIVKNAPAIGQTIYAAYHIRRRHSRAHQRLISIVRKHFAK